MRCAIPAPDTARPPSRPPYHGLVSTKQQRSKISSKGGDLEFLPLASVATDLDRIPMTVKVLLENLMRLSETVHATEDEVAFLASWGQGELDDREFSFAPARVLLQDFTGVPAVVDLAAMRSAIQREGGDPSKVDPQVPVDLVIDHSVQVDAFGTDKAFAFNVERE